MRYWPKICQIETRTIVKSAVLSCPSRSMGSLRRPLPTRKESSAPFEGLRRKVKTSPAAATGRIRGRKKTVRKKRLNQSHRWVNKTAARKVRGSLIKQLRKAKRRVLRKASQKIGSLTARA